MKENKLFRIGILAIVALLLTGCKGSDTHFITDADFRKQVQEDLRVKREALSEGNLFEVLERDSLRTEEREALEFLYAYMTLPDIVDYSGDFYLQNVRESFRAREEMSWGKEVPELLFRHFVLPIRVNNENLDSSRMVFYAELKERVKGMSMKEAALEVNHWCHEKATYSPSDPRTRSPLATVKNALGRCGEESTFTVAALRSVGIPARQVYTPRWAHTDDNHAWVEVWVDGKWYFIGACEPAAELNDAWFNSSVVRAMLTHTRVFGRYEGPEEKLFRTANYTEINCIDNYAPTEMIEVKVTDRSGAVVEGADIRFCIYNYSEFYPVVTKQSDAQGQASLRVGKGDMLIWAAKDGLFGYALSKADDRKPLTIALDSFEAQPEWADFKIVPPAGDPIPTTCSPQQISTNDARLLREDSIRAAYEATFATAEQSAALAAELGVDAPALTGILQTSRGNHADIEGFLRSAEAGKARQRAMDLLQTVSPKDLTDTPESLLKVIFRDMAEPAPEAASGEAYRHHLRYVASPRIYTEMLSSFVPTLRNILTAKEQEAMRQDPAELVRWVSSNIRLDTLYNTQYTTITPVGVWRAKRADLRSMGIFFVAMARTLGIPARYDEVTGKIQYSKELMPLRWSDVNLRESKTALKEQGSLALDYTPTALAPNPNYYSRFTVAELQPSGIIRTLYYDENEPTDLKTLFDRPKEMNAGHYFLVTGTRMASGSVLCRMRKFTVEAGKTARQPLELLHDSTDIQVIGSINAEQLYHDLSHAEDRSLLSTTGRGYFAMAILGAGQEPTNHALKDLEKVKADFEQWGRKLILLFPDADGYKRYKPADFPSLPETAVFGLDIQGRNAAMIREAANLPDATNLPIVIIADSFGRVVFVRQGYTIGLGEQMMQVIRRL